MNRSSTPSNRLHMKIAPLPKARSAAISCVNGTPRGLGSKTGKSPALFWVSVSAAEAISARNTMPAPPPAGVSSTARWRPSPNARKSWGWQAHAPVSSARPDRLVFNGPGNISGNRVIICACQVACLPEVALMTWPPHQAPHQTPHQIAA